MARMEATFSRRWDSFVGSLHGAMAAAGDPRSADEVAALTSYAFRLNVDPSLDPSGPTATPWSIEVPFALDQVGYTYWWVNAGPRDFLNAHWTEKALTMIDRAVEEGRPAIAFDVQRPEFGLIVGRDGDDYLLSGCADNEGGEERMARSLLGHNRVPLVCAIVLNSRVPVQPEEVARRVLARAFLWARGKHPTIPSYYSGLQGYTAWERGLRDGDVHPMGAAYHARVWSENRRAAALWLRGLPKLLPAAARPLAALAEVFEASAEALERAAEVIPWDGVETRPLTRRVAWAAADLVADARAAESGGMEALEDVLSALEIEPSLY